MNNRIRSGWTRFVMSLLHRPLRKLLFFEDVAKHAAHAEREFKKNYASLRRPDDPATFEEFSESRPSNVYGRTGSV